MEELERLIIENEDLKSKLIDLTFEMNYNKQTELIEFLRDIYSSVNEELSTKNKLTKTQVLYSLKRSIEEFFKDNRLQL
jgi:hypothetical protein